jgi:hypothetical protein
LRCPRTNKTLTNSADGVVSGRLTFGDETFHVSNELVVEFHWRELYLLAILLPIDQRLEGGREALKCCDKCIGLRTFAGVSEDGVGECSFQ